MVVFADVVRAPPQAVWAVLVDPARHAGTKRLLDEVVVEAGAPGAPGGVVRYRWGSRTWRSVVMRASAGEALDVEWRSLEGDVALADVEWRLSPIQLGTLLRVDVRGRGVAAKLRTRFWDKYWHRRFLNALKRATEGQRPSRVLSVGSAASPEAAEPKRAEAPQGEVPSPPTVLARRPKRAPVRRRKA